MAANYMAVQGSSVPCKRQFSSAGLIDTKWRNRLLARKFNTIEFLKSSYIEDALLQRHSEGIKRQSEDDAVLDGKASKRARFEE